MLYVLPLFFPSPVEGLLTGVLVEPTAPKCEDFTRTHCPEVPVLKLALPFSVSLSTHFPVSIVHQLVEKTSIQLHPGWCFNKPEKSEQFPFEFLGN